MNLLDKIINEYFKSIGHDDNFFEKPLTLDQVFLSSEERKILESRIEKSKLLRKSIQRKLIKMDYNEDDEAINSEIFELLIQDFIEKRCCLMNLDISDFCDFFHSLQTISQLKFITLILNRKKNE